MNDKIITLRFLYCQSHPESCRLYELIFEEKIIFIKTQKISRKQMGAKMTKQTAKQQQILENLPDMYTQISSERDAVSHPQLPSLKVYLILLNKNQRAQFEKQLKFRQNHRQELIQIMYGQEFEDRKEYLKAKVYVQQMVLNLQQLINLHFLDTMAIFHKVFRGFKLLYQNFGAFEPDPRMVGFNEEAVVKVWANVKYSKPRPKTSYQMMDEAKMIKILGQIFMSKVDIETLEIDSRKIKFKVEANTFQEAIKLIESHVQSVDLIPNSINAIKNLLTSGRKIDKSERISMNSEHYIKKIDKTVKFSYSKEKVHQEGHKGNKPKINISFGRPQKTKSFLQKSPILKIINNKQHGIISDVTETSAQSRVSHSKKGASKGQSRSLIKFNYGK